jgi:hypothetical protein
MSRWGRDRRPVRRRRGEHQHRKPEHRAGRREHRAGRLERQRRKSEHRAGQREHRESERRRWPGDLDGSHDRHGLHWQSRFAGVVFDRSAVECAAGRSMAPLRGSANHGRRRGRGIRADGKYYPLTFDTTHQIVRRTGIDYEGSWVYLPAGGNAPFSSPTRAPNSARRGVHGRAQVHGQSAPDADQFSPVPSKYVPLMP